MKNFTMWPSKVAVIVIAFFIYAHSLEGQDKSRIRLNIGEITLKEFVDKIESVTDYTFVYGNRLDINRKIYVSAGNEELESVLKNTFEGTKINYKVSGHHIILTPAADKRITISGYVTDRVTGESLISANVIDNLHRRGTSTNDYGFYSMSVPAGSISATYSYLGYKSAVVECEAHKDTVINVGIETNLQIKEVVIESSNKKTGFNSINTGAIEIPMQQIKHSPSLLGESDILKSIQMLPGVQSGIEGMSGISVRGGGTDQNLYRLDGVALYSVDHLFGFMSVFTPEAVKRVDLYKGGFPARFGGRLSSVVDVFTNDGDMSSYHGSISIGLLSSKLNFEGPIVKEKTSFNISARRSYFDLLARPFIKDSEDRTYPYFYDMNAKLNHKFSDRSRLYLTMYSGTDRILNYSVWEDNYGGHENKYDYESDIKWGNTLGALRWNYIFNNRLFSNTTISYNTYKLDYKDTDEYTGGGKKTIYGNKYQSGIEDINANIDFDYFKSDNHHVRFGANYINHTFKPELSRVKEYMDDGVQTYDTIYNADNNSRLEAHEASVYIEDDIRLCSFVNINAGVNLSMFRVREKNYFSIQPRISSRIALSENIALKASNI